MDFFVSCGEISGDKHLAYLIENIKEIDSNFSFSGIVGKTNKKNGVEVVESIDKMSIMGFSNIVKHYRYLKSVEEKSINYILENRINNIILVDYGGFNLKLLKDLKKIDRDFNIYYYIPPKLWIWGKNRFKTLNLADHILVIFPFEVSFYKKLDRKVTYFGNPLIDKFIEIKNSNNNETILLLPGSREQEILGTIDKFETLVERNRERNFIIKLADEDHLKFLKNMYYENLKIVINEELTEVCKNVKTAIAVSGTVTLELALMNIPTIVVYETSKINEIIGRYIMKLKYISLPNIIMDKEIFPELIQKNFSVENIENKIVELEKNYKAMKIELQRMRNLLGTKDITRKYANYIVRSSR